MKLMQFAAMHNIDFSIKISIYLSITIKKDLKKAFEPHNYTLSAALPGNLDVLPGSAEVMAELAESLDFITIIAYGNWLNKRHATIFSVN